MESNEFEEMSGSVHSNLIHEEESLGRLESYENTQLSSNYSSVIPERDTMNEVSGSLGRASIFTRRSSKSIKSSVVMRRDVRGLNDTFDASPLMTLAEFIEFGSTPLSSDEASISYHSISQSWAETDPNFFVDLGEVPSVATVAAKPDNSMGRFTNPLTGSPVEGSTESLPALEEEQEEGETIPDEEEEDDFSDELCFEKFDAIYPEDIVEKPHEEEITFHQTLNTERIFESNHVFFIKDFMYKIIRAERDIPKQFLDDIILKVTKLCEKRFEVQSLEEKLDKKALLNEIMRVHGDLFEERRVQSFLNRKCVEYFRRKGKLRFLTSDFRYEDFVKYRDATSHLDQVLGAQAEVEKIMEKELDLERLADEEAKIANDEVKSFEKLVKQTLKCEPGSKLTQFANSCLRSMDALRTELSEVRLVLIQRLHTISTLKVKINELNNLGQGLSLPEYENLLIETDALGRKIEDRKNMLAKQHDRFHTSLHTMAHINFTKGILWKKLRTQTSILNNLIDEKDVSRKFVNKLNLRHVRMRKEIQDLTIRSGLLAKPALLRDYDATVKNIEDKQRSVESLRQTKMDLEAKLKISEKTPKSHRIR